MQTGDSYWTSGSYTGQSYVWTDSGVTVNNALFCLGSNLVTNGYSIYLNSGFLAPPSCLSTDQSSNAHNFICAK